MYSNEYSNEMEVEIYSDGSVLFKHDDPTLDLSYASYQEAREKLKTHMNLAHERVKDLHAELQEARSYRDSLQDALWELNSELILKDHN